MCLRSKWLARHYFLITDTSLTVAAANSPRETMKSLSNSHRWSDRAIFKTVYWHSEIPSQLQFPNWMQSSSVLSTFAWMVLIIPPLQKKTNKNHKNYSRCWLLSLSFSARWLMWGFVRICSLAEQKKAQRTHTHSMSFRDHLPLWTASHHWSRFPKKSTKLCSN